MRAILTFMGTLTMVALGSVIIAGYIAFWIAAVSIGLYQLMGGEPIDVGPVF